jgi:hypothetical protein
VPTPPQTCASAAARTVVDVPSAIVAIRLANAHANRKLLAMLLSNFVFMIILLSNFFFFEFLFSLLSIGGVRNQRFPQKNMDKVLITDASTVINAKCPSK